ncbi:MAG: cobalamin B12-binding domain-containing protein [Nitrospinae bacterium]|nr:cobalamin B12-binding domain-containing protein [Nitrospinota bacterium]
MPGNKIRGFIGVKSNDGHDAAILVVADIMKKGGIEVILGGYDLTVDKFVRAVVQEGVHFTGISSYNGGHMPFFRLVRDELRRRDYPFIHIVGGGGATITPPEIEALEREEGIDKIFRSGEGHLVAPFIREHYDFPAVNGHPDDLLEDVLDGNELAISQALNVAEEKARLESALEKIKAGLDWPEDSRAAREALDRPLEKDGPAAREVLAQVRRYAGFLSKLDAPAGESGTTVYGIAGRGGAGKSALIDELVLRFFKDARAGKKKCAILAVDPSSHSSGGALLADRIAYIYATDKNWVDVGRIYIRSVASRGHGQGIARALPDMIKILKAAGYEIFVETYGTGQPDSGIVGLVDKPVFVATPDIGGAAQIAKEEMLNLPGATVALNKSELPGARHVSSLLRGRVAEERLFLTTAIEHGNAGVNRLYRFLTEHYS